MSIDSYSGARKKERISNFLSISVSSRWVVLSSNMGVSWSRFASSTLCHLLELSRENVSNLSRRRWYYGGPRDKYDKNSRISTQSFNYVSILDIGDSSPGSSTYVVPAYIISIALDLVNEERIRRNKTVKIIIIMIRAERVLTIVHIMTGISSKHVIRSRMSAFEVWWIHGPE